MKSAIIALCDYCEVKGCEILEFEFRIGSLGVYLVNYVMDRLAG